MAMTGLAMPRRLSLPRLPLGFALTFLVGVALLSGAIHIATILIVPDFAEDDGWSRLAAHAGENGFAPLPTTIDGPDGVAGLDPLFVNGACMVSLGDAPAGITVDAHDHFWSLALYDRSGDIVFSLNDRTAIEGRLDMIVANADQNAKIQKAPTAEIDQTIVTESPSDDLIALLRLFAPTRVAQAEARKILAQAECLPAPSVIATAPGG